MNEQWVSASFDDPTLVSPHADGVDLAALPAGNRDAWLLHRRWARWAANAKTDMPPDVYAGEPVPGHTGVATVDLWSLGGDYVDEAGWVAHEQSAASGQATG